MMVFEFKDTEIYVCESTAKTLIKCFNCDVLNQVSDFVVDNNYISYIVYSNDNDIAAMLTDRIGGMSTDDIALFEKYLKVINDS